MASQFQTQIDGVLEIPLRKIADERGTVFRMLRADDPYFEKFGEIYFSTIYPGVIKAWQSHQTNTMSYAVISGKIRLALFDKRKDSKTFGVLQEFELSPENYRLVRIPPGVLSGFKNTGTETAIVANCTTEPHDPSEMRKFPIQIPDIPYEWG